MAEVDAASIASEKTAVSSDTKLSEIISTLKSQTQDNAEKNDESNDNLKELIDTAKDATQSQKEDGKTQSRMSEMLDMIKGSTKGMSGILKGMDLRALREAKQALKDKMGAGWGKIKSVASKLTKTAGDIMKALLTGLGLAALWALIGWLAKQDFQKLYNDVTGFFQDFDENIQKWTSQMNEWLTALGIGVTLEEIRTAIDEFGGAIGGIFTIVKSWKLIGWIANFGGSSLSLMWNSLKLIFGVGGSIAILAEKILIWTTGGAVRMFGLIGSPLMRLWTNLKAIFGPAGKLNTTAINVNGWKEGDMFKKQSPLQRLVKGLKGIFGEAGKIAQWWLKVKEGTSWLTGKIGESSLGKFFSRLTSAFGPDGKFATVGNWVGEKWAKLKSFFTVGKDGAGPIARLFGFIGNMTSGIGGAWTNMKSAKWFQVVSKVFAGAKSVLGALLVPIRFLLLPLTWILGIGAGIKGFIDGFMGKEGVKDERSLLTKIKDGLKGAFKGLLDFFVIDLVVMVQDVMNWFVDKWNNSLLGSMKKFEKFSFGDDLSNATTKMLQMSEESAANVQIEKKEEIKKPKEIEKPKPIDVDKVLETAGGKERSAGRGGRKYEIGMDKFSAAIDKLDASGLLAMQEKMQGMDKKKNIELINSSAIMKRLQEEIKERASEPKIVTIDNSQTSNNRNSQQTSYAQNLSSSNGDSGSSGLNNSASSSSGS